LAHISKKICLLGEFAVGKTSLVRRFVYNRFDDKYISTIGVKVSRKTVAVPRNEEIVDLTMMLWDLAGSEEFNHVRASYLRGAAGAILVCDITRAATLDHLQSYAEDLRSVSPQCRLMVAVNKSDLQEEYAFGQNEIEAVSGQLLAPYYFTSAKIGNDIDSLFRHLGQLLLE